jgi:hypothetical protein
MGSTHCLVRPKKTDKRSNKERAVNLVAVIKDNAEVLALYRAEMLGEEGGDGKGAGSETPSLMSYILRYICLGELGTLCRVGLRDPMHLCTCVSEN